MEPLVMLVKFLPEISGVNCSNIRNTPKVTAIHDIARLFTFHILLTVSNCESARNARTRLTSIETVRPKTAPNKSSTWPMVLVNIFRARHTRNGVAKNERMEAARRTLNRASHLKIRCHCTKCTRWRKNFSNWSCVEQQYLSFSTFRTRSTKLIKDNSIFIALITYNILYGILDVEVKHDKSITVANARPTTKR